MYKPRHISKSKCGIRGKTTQYRILPWKRLFFYLFLTFILVSAYMSIINNNTNNISTSIVKPINRLFHLRKTCGIVGPETSAPNNYQDFTVHLKLAIEEIIQQKYNIIMYTTVNYEAAKNNLHPFLISLSTIQPSLSSQIIILCLDLKSCERCRNIHVSSTLCIYTDFGVSEDSLAPVDHTQKKDYSYFRLTFGRFYTVYKIMELYSNISVLSVDVDSIFFQNPFIEGQALYNNEKLAIVADVKHLNIVKKDDTILNGGFLYFPAITLKSYLLSKEVIDRVWQYNCKYGEQDDQYILSHILRKMYTERLALKQIKRNYLYRHHHDRFIKQNNDHYDLQLRNTSFLNNHDTHNKDKNDDDNPDKNPNEIDFITYLSTKEYMNYCNTNCGNASTFSSAYSYQQLLDLEFSINNNMMEYERMKLGSRQVQQQQQQVESSSSSSLSLMQQHFDDSQLIQCTRAGRQKWVFFHACCIQWPNNTRTLLSAVKGQVQESMMQWVAMATN